MKAFATSFLVGYVAAAILPREFNINEQLVLADCGIGTMPNPADSSSRQLAYYSQGFVSGRTPDMQANVPWDGSYPWRKTGVEVRFSNGDLFRVHIAPEVKDWSEQKHYSGSARHTYNDVAFQCWGDHGKFAFKLADGTKCTTAHICFHDPFWSPEAPKPDTPHANFTVSSRSESVRVQGTNADLEKWTPTKGFGKIKEAIEGFQCKDTAYEIGNDCVLTFDCTFGYLDASTLANVLTDVVAPSVEKTKQKKTGRYPGKCRPNGFCEPDYEFEYHTYEYPATGKVVAVLHPDGEPHKAKLQSILSWKVQCNDSGFCGGFCNGFSKEMVDALGGMVGLPPIGAITCSAC